MHRKRRRAEVPTTERRSRRADRAGQGDLMQRREVLLRSAARQLDW